MQAPSNIHVDRRAGRPPCREPAPRQLHSMREAATWISCPALSRGTLKRSARSCRETTSGSIASHGGSARGLRGRRRRTLAVTPSRTDTAVVVWLAMLRRPVRRLVIWPEVTQPIKQRYRGEGSVRLGLGTDRPSVGDGQRNPRRPPSGHVGNDLPRPLRWHNGQEKL